MTAIDTIKILDQLEQLFEGSTNIMGFRRVDEDEFFMLVSKLRASLPEDIRRAGKIAENTDRIMETAQVEADHALEDARAEAERLLSDARDEAVRTVESARQEAMNTVETARYDATQMLDGANAHAGQLSGTARDEAERLLAEARVKSATMTDQTEVARIAAAQAREIVEAAEEQARKLVSRAEADANGIRGGADDYARDVLFTLERHLQEAIGQFDDRFGGVLATVQRGRRALEQGDSPQRSAPAGHTSDAVASTTIHTATNTATNGKRHNGRR